MSWNNKEEIETTYRVHSATMKINNEDTPSQLQKPVS